MRDMPRLAPPDAPALPLFLIGAEDYQQFLENQPARIRTWLETIGFSAQAGKLALLPDLEGGVQGAIFGLGDAKARAQSRFGLASAAAQLPAGTYAIATKHSPEFLCEQALGWLLASYRFDRFRKPPSEPAPGQPSPRTGAQLRVPDGLFARPIEIRAAAEFLARDLINTPASHLGPEELEAAVHSLAEAFGAKLSVTYGEELLFANFPMIHAVGRASTRTPRLIDLTWGEEGPRVTLVGKGVCFDSGGLDIKPSSAMALMKKDMGGAACALAAAQVIMAEDWPVRLRVLIPAVENMISGESLRPGDILTSRKGLTVEVNNTDAEGRLILADALAYADEEAPDVLICLATLTGAARVALGPDLPALFTDDDALAAALVAAGQSWADPVWRMPLHPPYEALIEPKIADLDNAPSGGMAGAITAALFLRRFVEKAKRFAHLDIYAWQPSDAPGRPKGGVGQGVRAIVGALPGLLNLP